MTWRQQRRPGPRDRSLRLCYWNSRAKGEPSPSGKKGPRRGSSEHDSRFGGVSEPPDECPENVIYPGTETNEQHNDNRRTGAHRDSEPGRAERDPARTLEMVG